MPAKPTRGQSDLFAAEGIVLCARRGCSGTVAAPDADPDAWLADLVTGAGFDQPFATADHPPLWWLAEHDDADRWRPLRVDYLRRLDAAALCGAHGDELAHDGIVRESLAEGPHLLDNQPVPSLDALAAVGPEPDLAGLLTVHAAVAERFHRKSGARLPHVELAGTWRIGITGPTPLTALVGGALVPTEPDFCHPTLLTRQFSGPNADPWRKPPLPHHPSDDAPTQRPACIGCGWVGEPTDDDPILVGHDHAYPGWRKLAVLEVNLGYQAGATIELDDDYWSVLDRGAEGMPPVLTMRTHLGTRSVPGRAPGGGYDICGLAITTEPGTHPHEAVAEEQAWLDATDGDRVRAGSGAAYAARRFVLQRAGWRPTGNGWWARPENT